MDRGGQWSHVINKIWKVETFEEKQTATSLFVHYQNN